MFGVKTLGLCYIVMLKASFINVSRKSIKHQWFINFNAYRLLYDQGVLLGHIGSSGGFRGGALGASAPPAESMVKIS